MKLLTQLSKLSPTRGLIIWSFWENESDINSAPYVASQVDAFGNTNRFDYQTVEEARAGYKFLCDTYGFELVA